jgi:hypothetical protein
MNKQKIIKEVSVENPDQHWEYINVKGKRVLDLGCGDFGNAIILPYHSTLEYFLENEASFVLGVDFNNIDIENLTNRVDLNKVKTLTMSINNPQQIINLIEENNIDVIKCDIEGAESALFDVPRENFRKVEEYYIETHGEDLHTMCISKLTECGYDIYAEIILSHTGGVCKVLFAKRN